MKEFFILVWENLGINGQIFVGLGGVMILIYLVACGFQKMILKCRAMDDEARK